MRFCGILGLSLIALINGKYLLVEVENQQPVNRGPVFQCNLDGSMTASPYDSCNSCKCVDYCVGGCTKKDCGDSGKKIKELDQLCDLKTNNCIEGLICNRRFWACSSGHEEIGRCEKNRDYNEGKDLINKEQHSTLKDEKCKWKDLDGNCLKGCHGGFPVGTNEKHENICHCNGNQCEEDPMETCRAKGAAKGIKNVSCCPCSVE